MSDGNLKSGAHALDALEHIVRSVVEQPDEVQIDVDDSGDAVRMDVRVGQGDMGRVIGKRGRVAHAIRTVVRAAAVLDDVDVEVEFIDN